MAEAALAWEGSESLRVLLRPADELRQADPLSENPKRGNVEAIAESLRRFGQQRPILVDGEGRILAGNHTYRAAVEVLGWNAVAAVTGDLEEDEARAYILADNRTAELGGYDDEVLAQALADLNERGKLAGTGWLPDDLDEIRARQAEEAARAVEMDRERGPEPPPLDERTPNATDRQLELYYTPDEYARLAAWLRMLQREWETSGATESVFRAVKTAAENL